MYSPDNAPPYSLGNVATYNCNDGYYLNLTVGSRIRTCIDDGDNDVEGIFDLMAPTCDRKLMTLRIVHKIIHAYLYWGGMDYYIFE